MVAHRIITAVVVVVITLAESLVTAWLVEAITVTFITEREDHTITIRRR